MAHDFVDYGAWLRADSMSSVTRKMLTPLGLEVFEKARAFFGASPAFSGAGRKGTYLKSAVADDRTADCLSVFRDWLLNKGSDAEDD